MGAFGITRPTTEPSTNWAAHPHALKGLGMALLTATSPAITGTLAAPGALGTSNTISGNYAGGYLKVYNGSGGSINITFTDPGTTAAGNTGTQAAVAVADSTAKWFPLRSAFVSSATNLFTVTSSSASSVTYELLPPGTA